jgi:hypothetical protein
MLRALPQCEFIVTAGQLATTLCSQHFSIAEPKVGECSSFLFEGRAMRLYRMPSSSRAYPMLIEKKTAYYETIFKYLKP